MDVIADLEAQDITVGMTAEDITVDTMTEDNTDMTTLHDDAVLPEQALEHSQHKYTNIDDVTKSNATLQEDISC